MKSKDHAEGKVFFFVDRVSQKGNNQGCRMKNDVKKRTVFTEVEFGVTEFIVGQYGGFDKLAARAVIDAKKTHPEVILTLLLPYHPAERPIEVPQGFDGTYYPPDMERVPRRLAIVRANRYMVDHVDYLIAYAWHPASNARELVEYAKANVKILRVTEISRKRDVNI